MATIETRGGHKYHVDAEPNECPICHRSIDPRLLTIAVRSDDPTDTIADFIFQCPQKSCLHAFIGVYRGDFDYNLQAPYFRLKQVVPYQPSEPSQPPAVAKLSPQFIEVYRQADAAESWRLDQIAGCGYRKALEFLVKDYAILRRPDDAEAIKAAFLGTVIAEYLDEPNIQDSAERAVWLGNDETHYVRRWEDKDIQDLKALIELTVSWVNSHLLTDQYRKDMPKPPKAPKAKTQG